MDRLFNCISNWIYTTPGELSSSIHFIFPILWIRSLVGSGELSAWSFTTEHFVQKKRYTHSRTDGIKTAAILSHWILLFCWYQTFPVQTFWLFTWAFRPTTACVGNTEMGQASPFNNSAALGSACCWKHTAQVSSLCTLAGAAALPRAFAVHTEELETSDLKGMLRSQRYRPLF